MKHLLYCKACGCPLTPPLTIVDGKTPDVRQPDIRDKCDIVPRGIAYVSPTPWILSGGTGPLTKAPQIWMNLDDLLGDPCYTPHVERLSGCCGLSGNDPNRVCQCGEHIGTEQSDCWTPRAFIPDPATTKWKDEGE